MCRGSNRNLHNRSIILEKTELNFVSLLVAPWFESGNNVEAGIAGRNIKLKCRARGYPLEVEWRVTKKIAEDETITSCISKLQ